MTKLTLDDKEYEIEDMTDEQKDILSVLNLNSNSSTLLSHMLQCVESVRAVKVAELKESLEGNKDDN